MIECFRYSIDCKYEHHPTPQSGFLEFRHESGVWIPDALFLTANDFCSPESASQFLAITYQPKWEAKFVVPVGDSLVDNWGSVIPSHITDLATIKRVWPAFGKVGGATELVEKQRKLTPVSPARAAFPHGGTFDWYARDSVGAGYSLTNANFRKELISNVAAFIARDIRDDPRKDNALEFVAGKVDDSSFVVAWRANQAVCSYSISCGFREFNNTRRGLATELCCWGALWDDKTDELGIIRRHAYPIQRHLRLSTSIDQLRLEWHAHPASQRPGLLRSFFADTKNTLIEGGARLLDRHELPPVLLPVPDRQ